METMSAAMRSWADERGQATVEAALLLPTLMLCLALLVQPACMLYTRAVMQAAALEGCRLAATPPASSAVSEQAYRAYIVRRLSAVPNVGIFHEGGEQGWEIHVDAACGVDTASVSIRTTVAPLPFIGALASLVGDGGEAGAVVLFVEATVRARPAWVEGDYDDWSSIW